MIKLISLWGQQQQQQKLHTPLPSLYMVSDCLIYKNSVVSFNYTEAEIEKKYRIGKRGEVELWRYVPAYTYITNL